MRALQVINKNRSIKLNKIPVPSITRPTQSLIKVSYSPINPSDIGYVFNMYGRFQHKHYPVNLGFEGSGVIKESNQSENIGKNVIFWTNYENSE